jgi:hypothetical protein
MLKLILNVVTAGSEVLLSESSFLYAFIKEVSCLCVHSCFDTVHQVLVVVEEL